MKELTDEQINIAICEWRGWHASYVEPEIGIKGGDMWLDPTGGLHYVLPSHITGHEAIHNILEVAKEAAENRMNADQWEQFGRELERAHPKAVLTAPDGSIDYCDFATIVCELSARDHAIALLRVVKPELF